MLRAASAAVRYWVFGQPFDVTVFTGDCESGQVSLPKLV